MKKAFLNIFICLFVLIFAGLWIAGGVAEARSNGMKKREHHRHHSSYKVDVPKVIAVAAGGTHTIELKSDGTVWAWGWNNFGQLGDGTTTDSLAPIQVSGLTDVTAIAAGDVHSIALKNDGTIWAWGFNRAGQLGDGTTIYSSTPVQVSGLTDVTAIAAGSYHSIAIKTDGTVWAWGWNRGGQLGVETTETCVFPLMEWSCSTTPVQSNITDVTAIAAGSYHSIAIKTDGTVWTWGNNYYGQLGDGTTTNSITPVQVSGLTDVTAIAAGNVHSVALKNDGTVWTWGNNYYGQLGDGTTTNSITPVQVSGLTGVAAIAGGGMQEWSTGYTIALKTDGTVWAWGSNEYGQLGATVTETCSVSFGRWGSISTSCSTTPVELSGLTGVAAISAGNSHTLALKTDNTVWAWGGNEYGQLGDGTTTNSTTPVQVITP